MNWHTDRDREIHAEAFAKIDAAFRLIGEVREVVTLLSFQRYVEDRVADLGSAGFVESIGKAIVDGVAASRGKAADLRPSDIDLTATEIRAGVMRPLPIFPD